MSNVEFLRIPESCRSIDDALSSAVHLNLGNIVILSETENGNIVVITAVDLTAAQVNWILDRAKIAVTHD